MSTLKTNNIQHVDRSDPSIIINTDGSVNIAGTMTYEDVTNVDAVGIITGRSLINAQKQVHVGTGVSVKAGGLNVTAGITTVQALQATTGTFSGNVTVSGLTASSYLSVGDNDTINAGDGNDLKIYHQSSDNNSYIENDTGSLFIRSDAAAKDITLQAADMLAFNTGGANERVRITSAGKVGVGVDPTSYPGKFVVSGDALICDRDIHSRVANSVANSDRGFKQDIDGTEKLHLYADNSSNVILENDGGNERLRITSAGLIGIGTDSPQEELTIMSSTPALMLRDSDQGGSYTQVSNANQDMYFSANGASAHANFIFRSGSGGSFTERLRIDSDGQMSLGSSSNTFAGLQRLDIFNTSTADNYHGSLIRLITKNAAGNSTASYDIVKYKEGTVSHNNNESSGSINFYAGGATRLQVLSTGNINVNAGNLSFANGQGIDFSATSNTSVTGATTNSELLDDYEEGTWTASFSGDAGAGSFSYSRQNGWYTKIGNKVFWNFYIILTNISTNATGNLIVTGLPFTADGNPNYGIAAVGYYLNWDGVRPHGGLVNIGTPNIYIYKNNSNSTVTHAYSADLNSNTSLIMGGHYQSA